MVFNGVLLVSAAKTSAEVWQHMACLGERQRIEGQQMVDLVICFPLQQLGRLLLYLWTYLCVPPPDPYYYSTTVTNPYYHDDHDTTDDDDEFRYFYHHRRGPDASDDDDDDSSLSD